MSARYNSTVPVIMSDKMVDALDKFIANSTSLPKPSRNEVIRTALAGYIGYDRSSDPKPIKNHKYNSDAERKSAASDRGKAQRQYQKQLNELMSKGDIAGAAELYTKHHGHPPVKAGK